jgi:hypothetical protein
VTDIGKEVKEIEVIPARQPATEPAPAVPAPQPRVPAPV